MQQRESKGGRKFHEVNRSTDSSNDKKHPIREDCHHASNFAIHHKALCELFRLLDLAKRYDSMSRRIIWMLISQASVQIEKSYKTLMYCSAIIPMV